MRPIDADMLQELYNKRIFDTWNNETAPVSWAATYADFKDDIDSILTIPQPSNEPLTLKELREMNEEPVWVQNLEEPAKSQWRLLYWDRGKYLVLQGISVRGYLLEEYGESWLAYRCPPEKKDKINWHY